MKQTEYIFFLPLLAGVMSLSSCDSDQSDEVTEIIEARDNQVETVFPDEFVTGGSATVTTTTDYQLVVTSGDTLTVTGDLIPLGVEGKYSYVVLDDVAVISIDFIDEVAVDDADARAPWYSVASTAPYFADLTSGDNLRVAQGLNALVLSEGFQQTYFDVDENGQIFLIESMIVDVQADGATSLIRAGSLIDIDGDALDPLSTSLYFDLDRDFSGGGSTPNYVRVLENGSATFD